MRKTDSNFLHLEPLVLVVKTAHGANLSVKSVDASFSTSTNVPVQNQPVEADLSLPIRSNGSKFLYKIIFNGLRRQQYQKQNRSTAELNMTRNIECVTRILTVVENAQAEQGIAVVETFVYCRSEIAQCSKIQKSI